MNYLMSILIFVCSFTFGQSECSNNLDLQLDSLKKTFSESVTNSKCYLIKADSVAGSLEVEGSYHYVLIQRDSAGKTIQDSFPGPKVTEEMVMQGYCNCASCTKALRVVPVNKGDSLKVRVQSSAVFTFRAKNELEATPWYKKKYKKGDKIDLNEIRFVPGRAIFLRSAYKELDELVELMLNNPNLKVELQGHVNGPRSKNKTEFQELSQKRAEAVRNYLIKKGISESRMKAKGYGNTQMIYPKAVREDQMVFNRRVTVKIL